MGKPGSRARIVPGADPEKPLHQGTGGSITRGQGALTCPEQIWGVARRKPDQLNAAVSLASLRINAQF
jgi:hypothetical protein